MNLTSKYKSGRIIGRTRKMKACALFLGCLGIYVYFSSCASAQVCDPLARTPSYSPGNVSHGGISLNKVAELLSTEDYIFTGGTFDKTSGQIILFSQKSPVALPRIDPDDLVVAIRSIYELNEDPGVSIGTEGTDASGNFLVRYDGATRDTKFGQIMFEADLLLKWFIMGKDNDADNYNYTPKAEQIDIQYQSLLDRYIQNKYVPEGIGVHKYRIWFVPKKVTLVPTPDGSAFVFGPIAIDILTESKYQDQVASDPYFEAFAEHLRDNWALYSETDFPAYKQLKQIERLARIVGVVKWLKDNDIPVDLSFVNEYEVPPVATESVVKPTTVQGSFSETTTQIVNGRSRQMTTTYILTITGGVTYETPNSYEGADIRSSEMTQAALLARRQDALQSDDTLTWTFEYPGKTNNNASALSLSRSGTAGAFKFEQTDLSFPVKGTRPLSLRRFYNSFLAGNDEGLGKGWAIAPYKLSFSRARQLYTATLGDGSTINGEWYPEIKGVSFISGREVRYLLYGMTTNREPVYRADPREALFVGGHGLYQNLDDTFSLRYEDRPLDFAINWDTNGLLTSFTDTRERLTSYVRDENKRLIRIESGGRYIHIAYDALTGRAISAEGPGELGHSDNIVVTYAYDQGGNLFEVSSAFGHTTRFSDEHAFPTSFWHTSRFYYNSDKLITNVVKVVSGSEISVLEGRYDNPETETTDKYGRLHLQNAYPGSSDRLGNALSYALTNAYDATTGAVSRADSSGTTYQDVDEKLRLESLTFPDSKQITLSYTGPHGPYSISDRAGKETKFGYNEYGTVASVQDPVGRQANVIYYPGTENIFISYLATDGDPMKYAKVFVYNDLNQVTKIYNEVISFILTPLGATVNPALATEYTYNIDGELTGIRDVGGNETRLSYTNGQVESVESPSGLRFTVGQFDPYSRPEQVTYPAGQVLQYNYSANGNATDQLMDIKVRQGAALPLLKFDYDDNGNLMSVATPKTETETRVQQYFYTDRNELETVKDASLNQTHYSYLPNGNMRTVELPDAGKYLYDYDALQRVRDMTHFHGDEQAPAQVPLAVVTPGSLQFDTILIGSSQKKRLTVFNMGTAALTVSAITSTAAEFTHNASLPAVINPQENFAINVSFRPTTRATYEANLTVNTDDPDQREVIVGVSGKGSNANEDPPEPILGLRGIPADGRVSLAWDRFQNLQQDFAHFNIYRSGQEITGTNPPALLPIASPTDIGLSAYVDENVTNGQSYYYAVTAVDIYTNESRLAVGKSMAGPFVPNPSVPIIGVSTTLLEFGTIQVGLSTDTGSDMTVTVSNDGVGDLNVVRWLLRHPSFEVLAPPPETFTLASGESVTFTIRFHAKFPGAVEAALKIVSNDLKNSPQEIVLRGSGSTTGQLRTVKKDGTAQYTNIQAAINASSQGDVIQILDSSTYTEDLDIGFGESAGRNLKYLTIEVAPGQTPILDGSAGPSSNATMVINQTGGVRIQGLTIVSGVRRIWCYGPSEPCLIVNNRVSQGSNVGIFVNNKANAVIESNEISTNLFGILVNGQNSKAWILDNFIHDNVVQSSTNGKGVQVESFAHVEVHGNVLSNNNINIVAVNNATLQIAFNTIRNGTIGLSGSGDGVQAVRCSNQVSNVNCFHNTFRHNDRAGMFLSACKATIDGNNFLESRQTDWAIYGTATSVVSAVNNYILRSQIGIRFIDESVGLIANNLLVSQGGIESSGLIVGESVELFSGGTRGIKISNTDQPVKLLNNTILGTQHYGVDLTNAPNTELVNNILAYNTAGIRGDDIVGATSSQVRHCYLGIGNTNYVGQNNNITGELRLVSLRRNDYRLRPASVARNAGTNVALLAHDLNGNSRGIEGVVDIGAYETPDLSYLADIELGGDIQRPEDVPQGAIDRVKYDFLLAMGNTRVGRVSDKLVTISNLGDKELIVNGFEFSDPQIAALESFPLTVPPTNSRNITVRFTPGVGTDIETNLIIRSSSYYNGELIGLVIASVPPDPVIELAAIPHQNSVTLTWSVYTDTAGDFGNFRVYCSTNAFSQIMDEGVALLALLNNVNATQYEDTVVTLGTDYYYAVIPYDEKGNAAIDPGEFTVVGPVQANTLPFISNGRAAQAQLNGLVTITYDLSDAEYTEIDIWLEYWDGAAWQPVKSVTGKVGLVDISLGETGLAAVWNARVDTALNLNNCRIRAYARDAHHPVGETYAESADFPLDTLPPPQPSVNPVTTPTNLSSQTITGTKTPGNALLLNGVEIIPANQSASWSYSVSLVEENNSFDFSLRDNFGNESGKSSVDIFLDTVPPSAPVVGPVVSPTALDQQRISGSKEINSAIWLSVWDESSQTWLPAQQVYPHPSTAPVDISTSWAMDVSGLIEGLNRLKFMARDEAGNESASVIVEIIRDTTPPDPPAIKPLRALYSSPGNRSTIEITGTKDSGADLWINDVRVLPHSEVTDWSIYRVLQEGTNNLSFTCSDLAGNVSPTVSVAYVLDTTAEAVSSLSAAETNRRVVLTWTPITNVDGDFAAYVLYRSPSPISNISDIAPYHVIASVDADTYTDANVASTNTYYYAIISVDALGNMSAGVSTQITLSEWNETIVAWVVGNETVPTGAVYEVYFSAGNFDLTWTLPQGVRQYRGSVIADGATYYWLVHYTPSPQAPASETVWGAYTHKIRAAITPAEELYLNRTSFATVLKLSFVHKAGGDRLEAGFRSTHPVRYQIRYSSNLADWTPLHDSGLGSLAALFAQDEPVNPSTVYHVRVSIDAD